MEMDFGDAVMEEGDDFNQNQLYRDDYPAPAPHEYDLYQNIDDFEEDVEVVSEADINVKKKQLDEFVSRAKAQKSVNGTGDYTTELKILSILKFLHDLPMTLEMFQNTEVGLSVNNIRKEYKELNEAVNKKAREVLKDWKKIEKQVSIDTSGVLFHVEWCIR